jgi:hypothetical protein
MNRRFVCARPSLAPLSAHKKTAHQSLGAVYTRETEPHPDLAGFPKERGDGNGFSLMMRQLYTNLLAWEVEECVDSSGVLS